MASIVADNVSLTFPLVGSDSRFGHRLKKRGAEDALSVGGQIVTDSGRGNGIKAIDNFTLTLKDGDRLGIYGHNGAGKTTLLRVLAGIYPPTSGTLRTEGRITGLFSLSLGINKELSGLENIKIKAMMFGLRRREIMPLIPDIVAFSELGDYIHMPVKTYSSGMALRLQFSIATALKPDILLMDEWISSADKSFKEKMDVELNDMVERTPIVVVASHNEQRLYDWSNKVIYLKSGRIVSTEDTSDHVAPPPKFKPDPKLVKRYTVLLNLGRKDEALDFIGKVWPQKDAPFDYHFRRAIHFNKNKKFLPAYSEYEEALLIFPDNPTVHDQLGRLLLREGRFSESEKHLTTALKKSGGAIGSVISLKNALEGQGRDIAEIEALLETFV